MRLFAQKVGQERKITLIKEAIIGAFNTPALSIQSFFVYIDTEFFSPRFGNLKNLTMFEDNSFKAIVLIFYAAMVIGSLIMYYNRSLIGALPRALIKNGCLSRESAKTLSELGLSKNIFVKFSLRFGSVFRRIIGCVDGRADVSEKAQNEENEGENSTRVPTNDENEIALVTGKRYKNNFETDRFYVREKYKDQTELRFARKGNGILAVVLTAVIGIIAVVLIFKFFPDFIIMIDNSISPDGGVLN